VIADREPYARPSIIIGVRGRCFVVGEVRGAERGRNRLERDGRLSEIEAVGKIVCIRICVARDGRSKLTSTNFRMLPKSCVT